MQREHEEDERADLLQVLDGCSRSASSNTSGIKAVIQAVF